MMSIMSTPVIPCPNCGGKSWGHVPTKQATSTVVDVGGGQEERVNTEDLAFDVWKCHACQYAMFFIVPP